MQNISQPPSKATLNQRLLVETQPVLIDEGGYEGILIGWAKSRVHGTDKLAMFWRITTPGKANGLVLIAYFNLYGWDKSTPLPMPNSKYASTYRRLHHRPKSHRGYSPSIFADSIYLLKVATCKGNKRRPKPAHDWYSLVEEIEEKVTG